MPSEGSSRRDVIKAAGASMTLPAIAGCTSISTLNASNPEPAFRAGWQFQSEEPVLRHTGLATEGSESMVFAKILSTEDQRRWIKWDYLEEVGSRFVDHFDDVRFDEGEFLVAVAVLLPQTHTIDSSDASFEGGVLRREYDIVSADKTFDGLVVSNSLEKWAVTDGNPPEDVNVRLQYDTVD